MLIKLKIFKQNCNGKYLYWRKLVPQIVTYLNAIFGFLSILKAYEGEYSSAAIYIILAAIMDGFDGRLARALGSTSGFGMELDSLCDAISFCLAPVVLIYCLFADQIALGGKAALIFYLCAGLGRLAKFNTSSASQTSEFIGLPTTIAAFFIASLIFYQDWITNHHLYLLFSKKILFPIVSLIAVLIISKIKFYSFKKHKFYFCRDYPIIIFLFGLLYLSIVQGYPLIFFALVGYIISSLIRTLIAKN